MNSATLIRGRLYSRHSSRVVVASLLFAVTLQATNATPLLRISLVKGWNLVSFPALEDGTSVNDLLGSELRPVWYLSGRRYRRADLLTSGTAYWINVDTATTVTYSASLSNHQLGPIRRGWNLIGTLEATTVDPNLDTQHLFELEKRRRRWIRATVLEPGKGYLAYTRTGTIDRGALSTDSDSDTIPDYWESIWGFDYADPDDAVHDDDLDNLNNVGEFNAGTDPTKSDTDGDSFSDGEEVANASDPQDINSIPIIGTKLAFTAQPSQGTLETPLSAITIAIQNATGETAIANTSAITLDFETNPTSATLSGTKTVSAIAGVAVFDDLTVNKVGTEYTLTASAPNLTAAVSSAFEVSGLPAPSEIVAIPADGVITVAWTSVSGADNYTIYVSGSTGISPANATETFHNATSPLVIDQRTNESSYFITVTASIGNQEGTPSPEVSAMPTATPTANQPQIISGTARAGMIKNGTGSVLQLAGSGAETQISTFSTDARGRYTIISATPLAGEYRVRMTSATVVHPITGLSSTQANPLEAIVTMSAQPQLTLHLTPLSTIASHLLNELGTTDAASLTAANRSIEGYFGISASSPPFDLSDALDASLASASKGASDIRLATIIAGLAQLSHDRSTSLSILAADLGRDAADGAFEGRAETSVLNVAEPTDAKSTLAAALQSFLTSARNASSLDSNHAVITDLTKYLATTQGTLLAPSAASEPATIAATPADGATVETIDPITLTYADDEGLDGAATPITIWHNDSLLAEGSDWSRNLTAANQIRIDFAGATSGDYDVRISPTDVSANRPHLPHRMLYTAGVTNTIGVTLSLPAGLSPSDYFIASPTSSANIAPTRSTATLNGNADQIKLIAAIPKNESDRIFWAIALENDNDITINAESTAIALMLMTPGLLSSGAADAASIVEIAAGLAATTTLKDQVTAVWPTTTDPLDNASVQTALRDASAALLAALPRATAARGQREDPPAPVALRTNKKPDKLIVQSQPDGSGIQLANQPLNEMDWLVRAIRIDPVTGAPATGAEAFNQIVLVIDTEAFDNSTSLTAGLADDVMHHFDFLENVDGTFDLPDEPGLYQLRLFSGALDGDTSFFTEQDTTDWSNATVINILAPTLEAVGIVTDKLDLSVMASTLVTELTTAGILTAPASRAEDESRHSILAYALQKAVVAGIQAAIVDEPKAKIKTYLTKTAGAIGKASNVLSAIGQVVSTAATGMMITKRLTVLNGGSFKPFIDTHKPGEVISLEIGNLSETYIAALSPAYGYGEESITITGEGYSTPAGARTISVSFDGVPSPEVTVDSATELTVKVPRGVPAGDVDVTVTIDGRSFTRNDFFLMERSPVLTKLTPTSGFAASPDFLGSAFPGSRIILTGTGFDPTSDDAVAFTKEGGSGIIEATIDAASSTTTGLVVTVPAEAITGPVVLNRFTNGGATFVYASNPLTFTKASTPTLTDVTPNSGPVGTPLLITGTGFGTSLTSVKVLFTYDDGARADVSVEGVIQYLTDTRLTVLVPALPTAGAVTISLHTPAGTTTTDTIDFNKFTVAPGAASGNYLVVDSFSTTVANDGELTFAEALTYIDAGTTTVDASRETIVVPDLPPNKIKYTKTPFGGVSDDVIVHKEFYSQAQRDEYEAGLNAEVTAEVLGAWSAENTADDRDRLGGLNVLVGAAYANEVLLTQGLTGTVTSLVFDMANDTINCEGSTVTFTGGVSFAAPNTTLEHATIVGDVTYTTAPTAASGTELDSSTVTGNVIVSTDGNRIRTTDVTGAVTVSGNANNLVFGTVTNAAGTGMTISGSGNKIGGIVQDCASHGVLLDGGAANTIEGCVILDCSGDGIRISGDAFGHTIRSTDVGWNASTSTAEGNAGNGIHILGGRDHHVFETDVLANGGDGILIDGIDGNRVERTFIGSWEAGRIASGESTMYVAGNSGNGIRIKDADRNVIGEETTVSGRDNRINGNALSGIKLEGTCDGNILLGNSIGVTQFSMSAPHKAMLGNGIHGIDLTGIGITNTTIQQNFISSNGVGAAPEDDAGDGIHLENLSVGEPDSVLVTGNLITTFFGSYEPNSRMGIKIKNVSNAAFRDNQIHGNPVGMIVEGTDSFDLSFTGGAVVGARDGGIGIIAGAHDMTFTLPNAVGTSAGPGIVIRGADNVTLKQSDPMTGDAPIIIKDNAGGDVIIDGGSTNVTISELRLASAAVNLEVANPGTSGIFVTGCGLFSTDSFGMVIADGAQDITVGGLKPALRNRFNTSGVGLVVTGEDSGNVRIIANEFDAGEAGIQITGGADDVAIGDGTDADGQNFFNSFSPGVLIEGIIVEGPGSTGITIENSVMSPMGRDGDALSFNAPLTGDGIRIDAVSGSLDAPPVTIGGSNEFSRNVMAGVDGVGIRLVGSSGILIQSNDFGHLPIAPPEEAAGAVVSNASGIVMESGSSDNQASGNLVVGSMDDGIRVTGAGSDRNVIIDNAVGAIPGTPASFKNSRDGISVTSAAANNLINRNVVARNDRHGVFIGPSAIENSILGNSITENGGDGIFLDTGGNVNLSAPTITSVQRKSVSGTITDTITGIKRVEVFGDGGDEGQLFIGSRLFSGDTFKIKGTIPTGLNITATVTDENGNTSSFGGTGLTGSPGMAANAANYNFANTENAQTDVFTATPGTNLGTPVIASADHDGFPVRTSDNIVFVSNRSGSLHIWKADHDGQNPIQLTSGSSDNFDPAVSSDGTMIAFASTRDGNAEIFTMTITGTSITQLTTTTGDVVNRHPTWSPDGAHLAYSSGSIPDFSPDTLTHAPPATAEIDVFTMTSAGASQTNVTNTPGPDDHPAWSPDGTEIAFTSNRNGNFDVFIMGSTGSDVRNVTTNTASDLHPCWTTISSELQEDGSPNPTATTFDALLFSSDRDTEFEIFVIGTGGSLPTRLTQSRGEATDPNAGLQ